MSLTPKQKAISKALKKKHLIGWSEHISFPDWNIWNLDVKVDTGARSSALHVNNLKIYKSGKARFEVVLDEHHPLDSIPVTAPILKWAKVRSSNGAYMRRCFVRARAQIGPIDKLIDISLVSREKMVFRMLLGRKALAHDFIVDVSRRNLLG
ncbi:MAG: ATP-dependent zinc protease [Candidatus Hydrogenedens sp.]|nr:ATP-dependent zinc protease [Candidatus Hydrogenedens sp.]